MGVVIPQVVTEDRASGALIVDGGLRFDRSKTNIVRKTFSSSGNRKTWTLSFWHKVTDTSNAYNIFTASRGSSTRPTFEIAHNYGSSGNLVLSQYNGSGYDIGVKVDGLYRDTNAWYHFVIVVDTTQSTDSNRVKVYVNGTQRTVTATAGGSVWPSLNADLEINNGVLHNISANAFGDGNPMDGYVCLMYMVDGQALDPSYFGYTDPLTNVWRPKKLSSSIAFGTNGFYLPFDGSAPISQDQSGRGNDWTPVNFGGSNTIEKATGALPILNTDGGGKVARVGVRTDANASSLVLALPLVGIKSDFSNAVNSGTSNKTITSNNAVASSAQSNFYGGSWYFDGTSDSLTISASSDLNLDGMFTVEFWIYLNTIALDNQHPSPITFPGGGQLYLHSSNNYFALYNGTSNIVTTGNSSVTTGKWYHVAATRDNSNNCRIFLDGVLKSTASSTFTFGTSVDSIRIGSYDGTGGDINGYIQDLRIYKGVAKYTSNFIPASTDPDIVPDSPSGVSYSSNVTLVPSTDGAVAFDGSGDYLQLPSSTDFNFGTGDFTFECFAYFPDSSSDYGIYGNSVVGELGIRRFGTGKLMISRNNIAVDNSSNSTIAGNIWNHLVIQRSGSTLKMFINGIEDLSATNTNTYNCDSPRIGTNNGVDLKGFISNLHVVKGTALYTSNFTPPSAPISSVANTKLLCCKSQSSATAADVTPGTITANGNAAASNFNPFTVNINTQRGKQSGYATLNPLWNGGTLSNGNLTAVFSAGSEKSTQATIGMSLGKYYWEVTKTGGSYGTIGIALQGASTAEFVGRNASSWGYASSDGNKYFNTTTGSSYGATYTTGDTIGVSFDADSGTLVFYKNGISQGTAFTSLTSGPYFPAVGNQGFNCDVNFGQKPFKFPPPAGFQPLTLANTPRPTIVRPDQYVGIVTYTGTGAARSLNVGFKPDFLWIKSRNGDGYHHHVYDSVRGVDKFLRTSQTASEFTVSPLDQVTSFNRDGFSLGTDSASPGSLEVNENNKTYVAWAWKAGGNSNTFNINDVGYATASAAGLTSGTITPTGASVNTKSGFSILTYTGQTSSGSISHGLGKEPKFIITKVRSGGAQSWGVYHKDVGINNYLLLDSTGASTSYSGIWGSSAPTSTVINFPGDVGLNNYNTWTYVCYAWAEIPGFSKFGSYTSNNSSDGVVVNLGFRPSVVLVKLSGGAGNPWLLFDSARNSFNLVTNKLAPNSSVAENNATIGTSSENTLDFLSNGFKFRTANTGTNGPANTYIYAAWAETPSFNLYGAQANAR